MRKGKEQNFLDPNRTYNKPIGLFLFPLCSHPTLEMFLALYRNKKKGTNKSGILVIMIRNNNIPPNLYESPLSFPNFNSIVRISRTYAFLSSFLSCHSLQKYAGYTYTYTIYIDVAVRISRPSHSGEERHLRRTQISHSQILLFSIDRFILSSSWLRLIISSILIFLLLLFSKGALDLRYISRRLAFAFDFDLNYWRRLVCSGGFCSINCFSLISFFFDRIYVNKYIDSLASEWLMLNYWMVNIEEINKNKGPFAYGCKIFY